MITPEVPETITTLAVLAWVESGPIAIALGVSAEPTTATLSLTISSCARRLELSGTPPSSLMMTSIFLPATVVPFFCGVELDAGLHLLADRREAAGQRQNEPDLGGVLSEGTGRGEHGRNRRHQC